MPSDVRSAGTGSQEEHIIVNNDRSITVPKELRNIAVQHDHDIETVTFDCPRFWDGNDLSEMIVNINYVRSDGHEGTYKCKNIMVDNDDSNIFHFDWTVSHDVTDAAGRLTIVICVKKSHVDGMTSQVWHSQRCELFSVLPGLECDNVTIPTDLEYNGVQADYNQNNPTAADYIKNRPFYEKSEVYTFPNADYTTPYVSSEKNDIIIYKIADEFVKPKTFEGSIITAHIKGEDPITVELTPEKLYEYRDEETGELLSATLADIFVIVYQETTIFEGDDSQLMPPGVYVTVPFSYDQPIDILDSIKLKVVLKQIDKKFIPSLDYASVDDVNSARNDALSVANQAQTTANTAATKADQAQITANNAATKADQAQITANNAATKADQAQSTAQAAQSTANAKVDESYVNNVIASAITSVLGGAS